MYRKSIWVMGAPLSYWALQIDLGKCISMHWVFLWNPNFPSFPEKDKWKKNGKKNVLYLYVLTFLLSMLVFVESPGSPAPFSTSTTVLPAVLAKAGGDHIDIAEDWRIGISHHISIMRDMILMFDETEIEKRRVFFDSRSGVYWCWLMLLLKKLCFELFWSILYKLSWFNDSSGCFGLKIRKPTSMAEVFR